MEESRTKKTTRNMLFSIAYKMSDVILAFILRTIFIQTLGVSYLGISGLFSSILNVLSLMELGVGSAIAFSLYRPLAEKDSGKVAALMQLYKRVYTCIGLFVCLIGFGLTPFLGRIINLPENIDNLNIIYWLSVSNTAISYFLAYRRTLLNADQRAYLCTRVDMIFRFIRCAGLMVILIFTHSYILYLAFDVLTTLLSNIVITIQVKKLYPYLETTEITLLKKSEKKNIIKYMSSTLFTKFGQTVVTSTDSIIISAFISTSLIGYYSNYNMIYSNLDVVMYLVFSNITASVGNYAVTKSGRESYGLFKRINLVNYMLVCLISVCFFCLASPFVTLWVGKQYVLSELTVAVIALNFYITSNQNCVSNFMSAMGEMYYKNRYRALIEGIVNLISSILLVKYTKLGIAGVFLGTTICFVCGRMWMDARVLFRHWFEVPFVWYVRKYILRFCLFGILCGSLKLLTGWVFHTMGISVLSWLICACICTIICITAFWILWSKANEFIYLRMLLNKLFSRIKRRL